MRDNKAYSFDDLKQLTGYTRPADVERCLKKQGVILLRGKDGKPFTTNDALNQAMGISPTATEKKERVEFKF